MPFEGAPSSFARFEEALEAMGDGGLAVEVLKTELTTTKAA